MHGKPYRTACLIPDMLVTVAAHALLPMQQPVQAYSKKPVFFSFLCVLPLLLKLPPWELINPS